MVEELGKTTLGKPFILTIISSAENIKNLERYKKIQQQLANPYNLTPEKAKTLIDQSGLQLVTGQELKVRSINVD